MSRLRPSNRIPVAVAAVVNEMLCGSHRSLEHIFHLAGAPGEPPDLSHASKWKTWLLRANDEPSVDAFAVLGRVIEEFMEVDPSSEPTIGQVLGLPTLLEKRNADRTRLQEVLKRHGLRYEQGGRIVSGAGLASTAHLENIIAHKDLQGVRTEFDRAAQHLETDPASAITAACALLEALCKEYIASRSLDLPGKETLKPLWSVVQKDLGLDPASLTDVDLQKILTGLSSVVDGIAALRTHGGSAHGGGKFRYRMGKRHARLAVGAAHLLSAFMIEKWSEMEGAVGGGLTRR